MTAVDWDRIGEEAVAHLQALLRIDTTNPPGNERAAAEYLAGVLRAEGMEPVVIDSAPGRGNLVVRLKGGQPGEPLLLYGHLDVVPAEADQWSRPPFGGETADGYVWGRGALDMKGMVVQSLMTLIALRRAGTPMRHDLIFAATADEEVAGTGIRHLVAKHPDLIRAPWGITEFGGHTLHVGRRRLYPIKVAEKGAVWVRARTAGSPGHASVPIEGNAVMRLAIALGKLGSGRLRYRLTPAARGYVAALECVASGAGQREAFRRLRTRATVEAGLAAIRDREKADYLAAILHDTATPTILQAGRQVNVIPSCAEAVIDCRTLPGSDSAAILTALRRRMGSGIEFEIEQDSDPLEAPIGTPLYRLLDETLLEADPGCATTPFVSSGATDAKFVSALGTQTYGFSPLKLLPGEPFADLIHGHDERISVAGFQWGVRVLHRAVSAYLAG